MHYLLSLVVAYTLLQCAIATHEFEVEEAKLARWFREDLARYKSMVKEPPKFITIKFTSCKENSLSKVKLPCELKVQAGETIYFNFDVNGSVTEVKYEPEWITNIKDYFSTLYAYYIRDLFLLCNGAAVCHLVAMLILLTNIWKTRSCAGVSTRSQTLFFLACSTQHWDFVISTSIFEAFMKVSCIAVFFATLCLMLVKFKNTRDQEKHLCRADILIGLCLLLAHIVAYYQNNTNFFEVLKTFGLYMQTVAILPQIFLLYSKGSSETITTSYIFFVACWRALYFTCMTLDCYKNAVFYPFLDIPHMVQTVFHICFLVLYFIRKGKKSGDLVRLI